MKIKTKLNLGVGLLFAMILALSLISAFYIFAIKKDTNNILRANYNTLEYSRNMLLALDRISTDKEDAVVWFEQNLRKQTANVTEIGEYKITAYLQLNFTRLKSDRQNEAFKSKIRQDIFGIMKVNMDAIKLKSNIARKTAETANLWIAIAGTLCFLIAFNLLVNLPNNIANPIKELTQSIRQIADRNYSQRVHFANSSEFGDLARSFNTMAEKLQEYNDSNLDKLLFEKKRFETLLNNMHDPVIGLDNTGIILSANDEALRIMGMKPLEVIGRSASQVALRNDLLKSLIDNGAENAKVNPMKIYANGKESYFERETVKITILPTGEQHVADIGNFIILRNITAFKELDFAKTNFIATVSHELKTPIAAIKFSLDLLHKESTGKLNEEQLQLLESIGEDGERLLKITGELLQSSQLETGNIQLVIAKSDAVEIVDAAIEAVKTQAENKKIVLEKQLAGDLPPVRADAEKTTWVLINFLTNAIRYSPENGHVKIKVSERGNELAFEVVDAGTGIDVHYQSRIFERYFRVPGSDRSGTGLGLAISREFIEAQAGSIGVESTLGLGSTFYFTLGIG
jgi:PAS domain S-box-containing protein